MVSEFSKPKLTCTHTTVAAKNGNILRNTNQFSKNSTVFGKFAKMHLFCTKKGDFINSTLVFEAKNC